MTKEELAKAFSNGEFDKTYNFIAEDAVWEVAGENTFTGRQAIIDNCGQVSAYFKSVTTDFNTADVVSQGNKVVISGSAEFIKNNQPVSHVAASDHYEFNEEGKIQKIMSYCVQGKQ